MRLPRDERRGGKIELETPRYKYANAQEDDQEMRERSKWYNSLSVLKGSSLRVLDGGWVTMISDGVDMSIARGLWKRVNDPTPTSLFLFLYHVFIVTV